MYQESTFNISIRGLKLERRPVKSSCYFCPESLQDWPWKKLTSLMGWSDKRRNRNFGRSWFIRAQLHGHQAVPISGLSRADPHSFSTRSGGRPKLPLEIRASALAEVLKWNLWGDTFISGLKWRKSRCFYDFHYIILVLARIAACNDQSTQRLNDSGPESGFNFSFWKWTPD